MNFYYRYARHNISNDIGVRYASRGSQRRLRQARLSCWLKAFPLSQGAEIGSQGYHRWEGYIWNHYSLRDGDTIEIDGIAIRLAALNCPENDTQIGKYATKVAKQFAGLQALCELTGAKTYDRLVGYCKINGTDFGLYMMNNSACKVWEKYDVWDRY